MKVLELRNMQIERGVWSSMPRGGIANRSNIITQLLTTNDCYCPYPQNVHFFGAPALPFVQLAVMKFPGCR